MDFSFAQISNLPKFLPGTPVPQWNLRELKAVAGQRISYQIVLHTSYPMLVEMGCHGDFSDAVKLFREMNVPADMPVAQLGGTPPQVDPNDYVTLEPCPVPDVLVPMEEMNNRVLVCKNGAAVWVSLDIPADTKPGTYKIYVDMKVTDVRRSDAQFTVSMDMELTVLDAVLPEQTTPYTRWFYADCVAQAHHVEIFSPAHWELMEKYIAAAARVGVNTILTPIHTPPLDTAVGAARPCVQLVDVEKVGDTYRFGFDKLSRFIGICKKHGIKNYEMAHLFTQWGAKTAPNIMVTHDGVTDYLFGWHVAADGPEYSGFLQQYLPALCAQLDKEGVLDNCFFHISDEPDAAHIGQYRSASEILQKLVNKQCTMDALSNVEFCRQGLVGQPCSAVHSVHKFLDSEIENVWTYYCCNPQTNHPNSFLAMQARNNRVTGFLMYRYQVKGFLHWGLNFYNSQFSYHPVNPWVTTAAEGAFPSGDGFILYPGQNTVYGSTRGEVMYDALQDIRICQLLETYIGRDAVCEMIDKAAGGEFRFNAFPKRDGFLTELRIALLDRLEAELKK